MKTFYSNDHDSHYAVGRGSVVMAETEQQARELLDAQLKEHGLNPAEGPYTLKELKPGEAVVLCDGNY